jgi:hypothetical protein
MSLELSLGRLTYRIFAFESSAKPSSGHWASGPPRPAASPNELALDYLFARGTDFPCGYFHDLASGRQNSVGNAYLTTSMGPGTTVADEVAHTTFTAHPGSPVSTKLFSNVTLAPAAAYFLMIFANPGNSIDWAATNSPDLALGQGVFLNQLCTWVSCGGLTVLLRRTHRQHWVLVSLGLP